MATDHTAPADYGELAQVLLNLPLLVREKRRRLGLSQRAVGRGSRVSFATVSRCEAGHDMKLSSVLELLEWIGTPDPPPSSSVDEGDPDR